MRLVFLYKTGYAENMIFEQTIEIPELSSAPVVMQFLQNRSPFVELPLPQKLPAGKFRLELIVTPETGGHRLELARQATGESEGSPPEKHESWESLCGAAKDSKLSLERFMEMQREDIELENKIDERQWGAKW
jgi:hypothetical protein